MDLTASRTWFQYHLLNEQIGSDNCYFRVNGFDTNCNGMALVTLAIDSVLTDASKYLGNILKQGSGPSDQRLEKE